MNQILRILRLVAVAAALVLVVTGVSFVIAQYHDKSASKVTTQALSSTPASSPVTQATTVPQPSVSPLPVVKGIVNVNIHSSAELIPTNFVVTAWKDHPMTVLDASDPTWLHVRYLTTENQTVEGYVLKSLTVQG